MKIGPAPLPSMPRDLPASAGKGAAHRQDAQAQAGPSSSAKAASPVARTEGPPGLVKQAARFAAMEGDFKNAGQEKASSRIQQNLERYRQNQALAQPQAPAIPAPSTPDTPAASPEPPSDGVPPSPPDPLAALPEGAPEEPGAEAAAPAA